MKTDKAIQEMVRKAYYQGFNDAINLTRTGTKDMLNKLQEIITEKEKGND